MGPGAMEQRGTPPPGGAVCDDGAAVVPVPVVVAQTPSAMKVFTGAMVQKPAVDPQDIVIFKMSTTVPPGWEHHPAHGDGFTQGVPTARVPGEAPDMGALHFAVALSVVQEAPRSSRQAAPAQGLL
mmetsp:Transcript_129071/g.361159  ORF Transcript_129071/g.361159 Transcript_129071/m.361159 type:complete len:126 (-) Transcript_129071:284-661(-)